MKLSEQEIISLIDDKITEILTDLKDRQFTNAESRKELAHLIVRLCLSRDPRSRIAARKIGSFFTELGDELLRMYDKDGQKIINEDISRMKTWKTLFKEQPEGEENSSVAKNMSMAQSYLLKAARAQGMNPSRALYAIDDVLLLFDAIIQKKTYDTTMSNAVNKLVNILKKKWNID